MCIQNVRGARLVIISSLRNAMILTSDIKRRLKCDKCRSLILLEPEKCHQYRIESVGNKETYPKPPDYEMLDERVNNCIVLYYALGRRVRCLQCMKNAFSTESDPDVLTKTSSC